jgi:hypothetical protein
MTQSISDADREYSEKLAIRTGGGGMRPEKRVQMMPISPGRLGQTRASIAVTAPEALDHLAALAGGASDLRVRLDAARLILSVCQLRTPKTLVDAAKAHRRTAIEALQLLATGKLVGADQVAVAASETLINLLKSGTEE